MAKYILKKDLPFAKAGTLGIVGERSIYFEKMYNYRQYFIPDRYEFPKEDIKVLLNEGWIEEVKPREFIGYVLHDDKTFYMPPEIHDGYNAQRYEKIKVREVIE